MCPICNEEVECMNNLARFNRHVDKCLSLGEDRSIKGLVKTEVKNESEKIDKKEEGNTNKK